MEGGDKWYQFDMAGLECRIVKGQERVDIVWVPSQNWQARGWASSDGLQELVSTMISDNSDVVVSLQLMRHESCWECL
jgi:hypothetical protein